MVCEPSAARTARPQSRGSAAGKRAPRPGGAKRLNAPVGFVASGVLDPGQPPCAFVSPALAPAAAPAAALCDAELADVGMALAEDALGWDNGPCAGTPIRGPVGLGFACALPALAGHAAERGARRLHPPILVLLLAFMCAFMYVVHTCKRHCS